MNWWPTKEWVRQSWFLPMLVVYVVGIATGIVITYGLFGKS